MLLSEFQPKPALTVRRTEIRAPRFAMIDAHNHLQFDGWQDRPARDFLDQLDRCHVRGFVDLDGGWGEDILHQHLDRFKTAAPERIRVFGGVDWSRWPDLGAEFVPWAVERLRAQAQRGADGFKVWKNFGLHVRDHTGERVAVDDPRLDPLWAEAGALGKPLTFHIADPVAFFDPLDAANERWEELQANPDWHFPTPPFPAFRSLVDGMAAVVARHPQVTFIGAHVGCYAENLGWVGDLMARCPNFYADISARLGELGRQPYTARRFFLEHSDQILFGLDGAPRWEQYEPYIRFLETEDEYFPYGPGAVPGQGRWNVYGVALPEDVLAKVYAGNAEKILGFSAP